MLTWGKHRMLSKKLVSGIMADGWGEDFQEEMTSRMRPEGQWNLEGQWREY